MQPSLTITNPKFLFPLSQIILFLLTIQPTKATDRDTKLKEGNIQIIFNKEHECAPGFTIGADADCDEPIWVRSLQTKLSNEFMYLDSSDGEIEKCLAVCDAITNQYCGAVAVIVKDKRVMCNFYEQDYVTEKTSKEEDVAFERICCDVQNSKPVSNSIAADLVIVYDLEKDCFEGGERISELVKTKSKCNNKVWQFMPNSAIVSSSFLTRIAMVSELECLNHCIRQNQHRDQCVAVSRLGKGLAQCDGFDHEHPQPCGEGKCNFKHKYASVFMLACCRINHESMWIDKTKDIFISYDPKRLCTSHKPISEETKDCKTKVWYAREHTKLFNYYTSIKEQNIRACLNACSEDPECGSVTIDQRQHANICYLFKIGNDDLEFAHRGRTTYQLSCCDILFKLVEEKGTKKMSLRQRQLENEARNFLKVNKLIPIGMICLMVILMRLIC